MPTPEYLQRVIMDDDSLRQPSPLQEVETWASDSTVEPSKPPTLREQIANKIMVDCGKDTEFPCPHDEPTLGYEKCPHLDEDICMWQREQANSWLSLVVKRLKEPCEHEVVGIQSRWHCEKCMYRFIAELEVQG